MERLKPAILLIVIGVAIFVTGYVIGVKNSETTVQQNEKLVTVSTLDVLPGEIIEYVPDVIFRDTGSHTVIIKHDTIPVPVAVDTSEIISDYFKIRAYDFDTTYNNITIIDSMELYANKLIRKKQDITIKPIPYKNNFSGGISAGKNYLAPSISYNMEKWQIGAEYGILGQESGIRVRISRKLGKN